MYHNSATDRFAALQAPAVHAATERGARGEFEGQIEKELAEYLDATSQGCQGQGAASRRSNRADSGTSSPRRGDPREVTNLVKAPPGVALTQHEVTPWESWGYARAQARESADKTGTGGSAREGAVRVSVGGVAGGESQRDVVHVPVSATTKRRLAAEVRASTTATPRSPRRGAHESQASTHRSAASAGTEPRGNAILASLGRDVTRETLASVAASLSQPIAQASQVCEC